MIAYIKGQFVEKTPAYVVIETAGGVAYNVNISLVTFSQIKDIESGILFTHYVVKEDGHTLYGFYEEEERVLFRLLISVNGVGGNTARLILSSLNVGELLHAIATENVNVIKSVKGIGLKTAQRIVLDLKDKAGKTSIINSDKISITYNNNKHEALSALISLGFVKNTAESVLDKIIKAESANLSVEDLIKKALKLL